MAASIGHALVRKNIFEKVLSIFPENINYAFAYGSGIFLQEGHENVKDNMMDFVFVVDEPLSWHKSNMQQNRSHYSFVKYGGPKLVTKIQQNYGAAIYYNTLIPFENNRLIKYGVINTRQFTLDLMDWESLYLSGRLHKPVKVIKTSSSQELNKALALNLNSAVHTALLCLPEVFSEKELYQCVAALSYSGDFRMIVGEDKNKVKKIVEPQMDKFRIIYQPVLKKLMGIHWNPNTQKIEQDTSVHSRLHHLNLLPRVVQHRLLVRWCNDGKYRDTEDVLKAISCELDCGKLVLAAVSDIVWKTSWSQSLKGFLTAGATKSIRYGSKKLYKMIKGMKSTP